MTLQCRLRWYVERLTSSALLSTMLWVSGPAYAIKPEAYKKYLALYKRPKEVPYPKENAFSQAREDLGKTLFFDPRLSAQGNLACVNCHTPALSWGDGLARSVGHDAKLTLRRAPTLLNLAWMGALPWDGKADSIDKQAAGPISLPAVQNLPIDKAVATISGITGYREMFAAAYPGEPIAKDTIGKALATFERSIVSGTAPFDRWVAGDEKAVSDAAKRGFVLFNEKGACARCHSGWRFTDDSFHDIGLAGDDLGRGKILPEIDTMQHAFKVPTLRNADHRAPYMHDGSVASLAAVVDYYDKGGSLKRKSVSEHIKELKLSKDEKADLLSFLTTLTSKDKPVTIPVLPR